MTFVYFLILVLKLTALLICLENTFWSIKRDENLNFVKLFKKSFTLYVESGMTEIREEDIEILKNEQDEFSAQPFSARAKDDFNAKFYKFIVDHYLRKFHCFYLHSTHVITVFAY